MKKGWIFLDIDGTITTKGQPVPKQVIQCLDRLHHQGWRIAFVTGRTFSFAYMALQEMPFPYFLGVQNGADLLSMPEKKLLSRAYLDGSVIAEIEEITHQLDEDFLIYTGYDKGDFCFYRPKLFTKELLDYLEVLKKLSTESWRAVESFPMKELSFFPLIKCFGSEEQMQYVKERLKDHPTIEHALIKDPMIDGLYLQLLTNKSATKGSVVRHCANLAKGITIAAGDDWNDYSMLQEADIKVVIKTAPEEILALADIVAGPADEFGIIAALEKATQGI